MKVDVEHERLVTLKQLEAFGVNPHAIMLVLENYIAKIAPLPVKYIWEASGKDDKMDDKAESKGVVEMYIVSAGYVGKKIAPIALLDTLAANLACHSYYKYMRPLPVSFQLGNAIEFHFRTPGVSDSAKKNPFREHTFFKEYEKEMRKKKR
jgi:hypothetical protein